MKKLLCTLLLLGSFSSQATLIDFDTATPGPADPLLDSGFTFDFSAGAFGTFADGVFPGLSTNGTTYIGAQGGDTATGNAASINMFATDNSLFSLVSFDAASLFASLNGSISVVGVLADNSTVSQVFNLSGAFASFNLSDMFIDLQSVAFTEVRPVNDLGGFGATSGLALDNINTGTAEVPEPASFLLLLLGLAGVSVFRKKHN